MRSLRFIAALLAGTLGAATATAQLPQVAVPQVPLPETGRVVPGATQALGGTLRELTQARVLRADRLLREHRGQLDRDPRGELVIRAEVVAIDITRAALDRALQADFRELRTEELAELGIKVTVLQTPQGMSAARGLRRLRKLDPEGVYDFNHVYLDSGEVITLAAAASPVAPGAGRVGLIDSGVDATHRAFANLAIRRFGCEDALVPAPHGTAVASLLVRRGTVAELFAADVYCGAPTGGAVDGVAAAFGWMSREQVAVINVSLVGPRNALLERVVKALVARGHVIVAAVGNDGPAAAPLYPAAYDGVVGVTGVDAKHRVLLEACRGAHVDFAAPGANVSAAAVAADPYTDVRGTSFAAPVIAAMLASMTVPDASERARRLEALAAEARDLGKPGRDEVYGAGGLGL